MHEDPGFKPHPPKSKINLSGEQESIPNIAGFNNMKGLQTFFPMSPGCGQTHHQKALRGGADTSKPSNSLRRYFREVSLNFLCSSVDCMTWDSGKEMSCLPRYVHSIHADSPTN
jgi:hypothetical protein